jgi:PAS domain S-box-containing protein
MKTDTVRRPADVSPADTRRSGGTAGRFKKIFVSTALAIKQRESPRQAILLNAVLLVSLACMVPFGALALRDGETTLVAVDAICVAVLVTVFLYFRISKNYTVCAVSGSATIGALCLYLIYCGGIGMSGHVWSFTFPLFTAFLLGTRAGTIMNMLFFAGAGAIFVYGERLGGVRYAFDFALRYAGAYLAVAFLGLFFEKISVRFEKKIREENLELERSNEQLREALHMVQEGDAMVESLIERASDGILLIQDKTVRFINTRLAALGGYSVAEVVGNPFTAYIHQDYAKDLFARYMLRIQGVPVTERYPAALRHRDGSPIPVEVSGGRIFYKGRPADLVFIRERPEKAAAE